MRDASMIAARVALSAAASSTKNVILSTAYVEVEEEEIEVEEEEVDDFKDTFVEISKLDHARGE